MMRPRSMITTRSQSSSTSGRMWVESSSVCCAPELADQLADRDDLPRIEADRRLVEHQDARVVEDGGGEAHALAVALGEGADDLVAHVGEQAALEGDRDRLARLGAGQPFEPGAVGQVLARPASRCRARRSRADSRPAGAPRAGDSKRSLPSTVTRPPVGGRKPVIMRMVVVLPAPFGPSIPRISPSRTEKEMPSTAVKSP